ncbi:MAG: aminodeoxychorismate/anthranilate synthase component II [Lachnospiraceae bacterium]|nr:aminodeoxychorismate/anthranilate synthase component II [Lachnospiraceae bacterium]
MILLIDNYDSFSYNLYQMVGSIDPGIKVIRNDEMSIKQIEELDVGLILLSPGPGRPEDAGVCLEAVKHFAGKIPILGVCLGHQAIAEAYGAEISYAGELMHGKQSEVLVDRECHIFKGLPDRIKAARYHSLAVKEETLPEELVVTAKTEDGEIMALRHKKYPVYGVQFHPESILTPDGEKILRNFICG